LDYIHSYLKQSGGTKNLVTKYILRGQVIWIINKAWELLSDCLMFTVTLGFVCLFKDEVFGAAWTKFIFVNKQIKLFSTERHT